MIHLDDEDFERVVDEAIASIPDDLMNRIDNMSIDITEEPTTEQRASVHCAQGGELLGLYRGVPLPTRARGYGVGNLPDQIWLFRGPIKRVSSSVDGARDQVRRTILHEIGHHFGMSDARLRELGY